MPVVAPEAINSNNVAAIKAGINAARTGLMRLMATHLRACWRWPQAKNKSVDNVTTI